MTPAKPIFVFSLPRSGSTLLQRSIAAHPGVATLQEPWILLPVLYATRPVGVYAEYRHELAALGTREFARALPDGPDSYFEAVRSFVIELYTKAARGKPYFLDKTPRYHLISDEVIRIFPDAKFIFLWRNPLAVAASMITTWGSGNWNLFRNEIDLNVGLASLVKSARATDNALQVRYEDLVATPNTVLEQVWAYLDLDPRLAEDELPVIKGMMGDKNQEDSIRVNPKSTSAWLAVYNTPLRRHWARIYLEAIGDERIEYIGYSRHALSAPLGAVPTNWKQLVTDIPRHVYGQIYRGFDRLVRRRNLTFSRAILGQDFSPSRHEIK